MLRAPDGVLTLGTFGSNGGAAPLLDLNAFASKVVLLPGSITSVSMNGATVPFGGTSDGTSYTLNGTALTASTALTQPVLSINAQTIQVRAGATIDTSGGGVLAGAGFISGRGGSTDILQAPRLALTVAGKVTQPSAATNLVYAILPGFTDAAAPRPPRHCPLPDQSRGRIPDCIG